MESIGLQNAPMKSLYNPGEDRSAESGQQHDLGSVNMGNSNNGLFDSVQNMGGPQQGQPQQKQGEKPGPLQKYGGFMRKLRMSYDWAPKLGIANQYGGRPQQGGGMFG